LLPHCQRYCSSAGHENQAGKNIGVTAEPSKKHKLFWQNRLQILRQDKIVHHEAAADVGHDGFNHGKTIALIGGDGAGIQ
jgi:hypothetical protein